MTIDTPTDWRDPEYIGAVLGILALGAFAVGTHYVASLPSVETVVWPVVALSFAWTAYRVARRQ